jgi:hypothetical protein
MDRGMDDSVQDRIQDAEVLQRQKYVLESKIQAFCFNPYARMPLWC